MKYKILIRDSELDTLIRVSGLNKTQVLHQLLETFEELHRQYPLRIKKQDFLSIQSREERPFGMVRVHKPSKIKIRYSMFININSGEMQCMAKFVRSNYPYIHYDCDQIRHDFLTDAMKDILTE